METLIIEKQFSYKDFDCVITFNTLGLFRCGYVAVPISKYPNIIHTAHYLKCCCNGITYIKDTLHVKPNVDNVIWVGFDCLGSGMDLIKGKELFTETELEQKMQSMPPRYTRQTDYTLEEVEKEIQNIVNQIIN